MVTPELSIVVTTRNEEANLATCLQSIVEQTAAARLEVIVVDNGSTDNTREIAERYTPHVFEKGPERSAQRNYGMLEVARSAYVMYVDADMILAPSVAEAAVRQMRSEGLVGLYIPEVILGRGFWGAVRRFERSFYDGTVIDVARVIDRGVLARVGGFDPDLCGPEDWDLDKRLKQHGRLGLLTTASAPFSAGLQRFLRERGVDPKQHGAVLFHNEAELHLARYLSKKRYYTPGLELYAKKWGRDEPDVRRQLGARYRLAEVFLEQEKWKRCLRAPHLSFGVLTLRGLVGLTYVAERLRLLD
jgi:glycosyltransferase involved in cell wall biosynthesis